MYHWAMTSPLYIAELSANHNNSIEIAKETIRTFAAMGASAIKLQTYTPSTMTLDIDRDEFKVPLTNKLWGGRKLFDLYGDAMTPWEWHGELFDAAKGAGILAFSTPFDHSAVDFLETLDCPIYKIASFEVVDVELIRYAAGTGKPMIISTGMASLSEIEAAVEAARSGGCKDLTLLKTTSAYPASPKDSNLRTMPILGELFDVKFGISDHTLGVGASLAAISLGASAVEKHVTLARSNGGVDSAFSMEPAEFELLTREAEALLDSLGEVKFGPSAGDRDSLAFRRTLYVSRPVKAGDKLSRENVRAIRPGFGAPVSQFTMLEGLEFSDDFEAGTPVSIKLFK